jgi:hypothetical protein
METESVTPALRRKRDGDLASFFALDPALEEVGRQWEIEPERDLVRSVS